MIQNAMGPGAPSRLDIALAPVDALDVDVESRELEPSQTESAVGKPRVLHVLASLSLGGIETWLMHMLRHRQQFSVSHELLLTREEAGEYEEEVRRLGIPIHRLPIGRNKRQWLESFKRFVIDHGPFAAVHSHVYLFSAPLLAASKKAHVPVRIAHCHAARSRGSDHQTLWHRVRRAVAIVWLKRSATRKIGISDAAIEEIAGSRWRRDERSSVLLYGFDFSRYGEASRDAIELRRRLGIQQGAPVVGHVGRFHPVKNHAFLLRAFAALQRSIPHARLVLVGEGPDRDKTEALAQSLGIADATIFPGETSEIPAYMAMFDLFVLPSFSEGLGIVVVEAQAAGTRSIVSDAVAPEAAIVPGAVEFLSLSSGSEAWARRMAESLRLPAPDAGEWLAKVERSRFAVRRCIEELDQIYRSELARTR